MIWVATFDDFFPSGVTVRPLTAFLSFHSQNNLNLRLALFFSSCFATQAAGRKYEGPTRGAQNTFYFQGNAHGKSKTLIYRFSPSVTLLSVRVLHLWYIWRAEMEWRVERWAKIYLN